MVSCTQQSSRIRQRKARKAGTQSKRENRAHGTPKFPVHPVGYDPSAPDAVRPAKVAAASSETKASEKKASTKKSEAGSSKASKASG